ncbi:hypothetical protein NDU88_002692 [Pleurodeles waltl]|uniref:Uncharacterized protein n=1 Tax=Pleurodeles waltl TaxID=8319 RepID=A0AAV7M364_PLEWA|nr:hypothetical protein NDU88_002692 [Pleurodeles waltl]
MGSRAGELWRTLQKTWSPNGARLRGSGEGWGTSELSARRALCSWGPEYEHAASEEVWQHTRNRRDRERSGLAGNGAGARGCSLGRRSAEGVLRRREARPGLGSRSEPHQNTAARRRAEPVGPYRRTIGTCARSRGREDTGSDPLDT